MYLLRFQFNISDGKSHAVHLAGEKGTIFMGLLVEIIEFFVNLLFFG